MIMPNSTLLF